MNRRDLTRELAAELGRSNQSTEPVVEALVRVLGRSIVRGDSIVLSNFGTLRPVLRQSRSYGPSESTDRAQQATIQVKFKPADKLLEAIRANDPHVNFRKSRGRLPRPS